MANKRKNLYLYLTLACFLGIIAIFIFDGYMGIYDTITVKSGEFEREVESDYWLRNNRFWSTVTDWGDRSFFTYEIANRSLSTFEADVEVTVWQEEEKVRDIVSRQVSISPFDEEQLEWTLDTTAMVPEEETSERSLQFTVLIERGDLERRIIWNISPSSGPPKPAPVRPRGE